MSNTIIVLALVVISLWSIWRTKASNKARIELASQLDSFLGDTEVPEDFKVLAYSAYEDSFKHFLIVKITFWMLRSDSPNAQEMKKELKKLKDDDDTHYKEMHRLVSWAIFVNMLRSPVTWILCGLFVLLIALPGILLTLSPFKAKRRAFQLANTGIYNAIHH